MIVIIIAIIIIRSFASITSPSSTTGTVGPELGRPPLPKKIKNLVQ